jgi:hypothetical protein
VDATELPIRNYDNLRVDEATGRIERLRDADQVRTVLAYEQANKNRKGVVDVAHNPPRGARRGPRARLIRTTTSDGGLALGAGPPSRHRTDAASVVVNRS